MKKRIKNRKALSPVVASVLLIVLVVVLALIIFLWAKGFLSEQIEKFDKPIEDYCSQVDFNVEKTEISGTDALEVVNKGNVDIFDLEIKMYKKGTAEMGKFKYHINSGESTKGEILLRMSDGSRPDKIIVYPSIIGKIKGKRLNRIYTCMDKGKTLTI